MPNSVESLGCIKCYSSSSPRPIKSPSISIRYNRQKICCWSRPETIHEIRKKPHFSRILWEFHFMREFVKFYEIIMLNVQIECNTCNKLIQNCLKIEEGRIVTDLYFKTKDGHQYLHYKSCHSKYTRKPIIFSETLT